MSNCTPIFNYADSIVTGTFPTLQAYANEAYNVTFELADRMARWEIPQAPANVTYNVLPMHTSFATPTAPTRTIDDLVLPDEPAAFEPTAVTVRDSYAGAAPREPNDADYRYRQPGGEPGPFDVDDPGQPPALDEIDVTENLPEAPTFYALDLPEPPDLLIDTITFDGVRPTIDFNVPAQSFSFTETPYSSDLADDITARLRTMMLGGTGLPAVIEQALFDRARGREDLTAAKAVQEVTEEFAARGFTEPNGILAQRLLQVRQNNQNQANALNRDLTIRVHEVEVENLRFAVVQGIAWEQVQITAHLAREERRFLVARYQFDSLLAVFNAEVALHNAEVEAYKADAQVYRERLQAEAVKADVYRAEVDGQKAVADINKSIADRFDVQTRAVLEQARIRLEANTQRLLGYRALVEAYGARVGAYEAEWRGFSARVQAELGNVQAAEIAARNYSVRVSAWGMKHNVAVEQARADIAIEGQRLAAWQSDLQRFLGIIEGRRSQIAAQAQALTAEASVYSAAGQVAQAAAAAADRAQNTEIERHRVAAELYLKQSEINQQQALQVGAQLLEGLRGAAQVIAQIASSLFAAMNVSASISSGTSNSTGCSTSYNYSGELET